MATRVDQKLLRQTKFPPEFNQKVDMKKVNVEVMKKWIAGKISEILGSDDDVVIELCFNLLEGSRFPDIKALQISLTGFLDKDTPKFCKELWNLCLSAQDNSLGVPKELLEAKKLELMQEKIHAEKAAELTQRRTDPEMKRERDVDTVRQRERTERGRGRGGRGGGRGFDTRPPRDSHSPPRRRGSPYRGPPRREADNYVPGVRGGRANYQQGRSRTRSLSKTPPRQISPRRPRRGLAERSRSASRSPPRKYRRHSSSMSRSPDRLRPSRDEPSVEASRSAPASKNRVEKSRSRTPIRRRRTPSSSLSRSPSRSRTPTRRPHRRRRSYSSLSSRSRSRDRRPDRRPNGGRRRSPPTDLRSDRRADIVRNTARHDDRRLSRSPYRSTGRQRRSPSHSRSPSRSLSPVSERRAHGHGHEKRRRSLKLYEPAGRRRRNTSSTSSPEQKRRKRVDSRESIASPIDKAQSNDDLSEATPSNDKVVRDD